MCEMDFPANVFDDFLLSILLLISVTLGLLPNCRNQLLDQLLLEMEVMTTIKVHVHTPFIRLHCEDKAQVNMDETISTIGKQ